jgi:hypothetical protein
MYPIFLQDVTDAVLEDKMHAVAARRLAREAMRTRKARRDAARHHPAVARAAALHPVAEPAETSERELTSAAR